MSHEGFRFDDRHLYGQFWYSINNGWEEMEYMNKFEKYWGRGAKPETILLSAKDYDTLVERLNEPPDPKVVERFREIMNRRAPWDE